MSNEKLKELREGCTPQDNAEMILLVKKQYPGFDKSLLSKCTNSQKYGVQLVPEAMKILLKRFGQEQTPEKPQNKRTSSGHRFSCRISARLPDADYAALQQRLKADGYKTMQAWLAEMVRQYLQKGGE
ncbi:MAG: hypothetical protein Q4D42_13550 [Eubacteriales bacterium]|nr:hypothetical protein [Eubacteriales bacterium]